MQKIKDERLQLKNLQNIRVAFLVQTLGIIGILTYELIQYGMDKMTDNPLWLVLILSTTVFLFLSINISVDHENPNKSPKKGFTLSLVVLGVISIACGCFTTLGEGFSLINGLLFGGVVFVCGLFPVSFIYYVRQKNKDED
jgi:hypothetical protein